MSSPPIPKGLKNSLSTQVANRLHSTAIHLLRRARADDRASGIGPARLSLLSVLVFAGPKTASQLAETEMVSRPAITRMAKSLEEAAYIRRETVAQDRRQVLFHATAKGRQLMEKGRRQRVKRISSDLQNLSRMELEVLDKATRILENIESKA